MDVKKASVTPVMGYVHPRVFAVLAAKEQTRLAQIHADGSHLNFEEEMPLARAIKYYQAGILSLNPIGQN